MKVGSKVKVTRNEGSWLHEANWWPASGITGTVERICKNGQIRITCDQLQNRSQDGRISKYFGADDKVSITEI